MSARGWSMRMRGLSTLALVAGVAACGGGEAGSDTTPDAASDAVALAPNTLTPEEQTAGWKLLFDGASMDGWRGYGRQDLPDTWVVLDGVMTHETEGGNMDGGDIVTVEEFTDFELTFDFMVGPSGNSGVFYRVREADGKGLWQVAPEYQVLDDPAYGPSDDWDPVKHRTGENYDLQANDDRTVHPVGEWNSGRIVVQGTHVEHWLNGRLVVAYEYHTPEWEALVANSKFAAEEYYARAPRGSIGLQDHGTPVSYRNMKIRPLD